MFLNSLQPFEEDMLMVLLPSLNSLSSLSHLELAAYSIWY